jgi:hypothetical protein
MNYGNIVTIENIEKYCFDKQKVMEVIIKLKDDLINGLCLETDDEVEILNNYFTVAEVKLNLKGDE